MDQNASDSLDATILTIKALKAKDAGDFGEAKRLLIEALELAEKHPDNAAAIEAAETMRRAIAQINAKVN